MVEVREARYFIAVAEELHFGRAAERLNMSQPPLSQAVKILERRLGVFLLHRTTREVRLTAAGAVFLDACRALVVAATSAEAAARQAADGDVGTLRVGVVTTAFSDPLPRTLDLFRATHPRAEVQVEEIDTEVAVNAVRRRELDLALVRHLAAPSDCQRVVLRRDRFVLAVPAGWETAEEPLHLASTAGMPWIWLPRSISPDYHDQVVACCRAADFSPDAHHVARSVTSQLAMVACGLGVALVPDTPGHLRTAAESGGIRFVRLQHSTSIEVAAVWRREAGVLVDGFVRSARAVVENPHAPGP
jgi:DNA-binding transcriptional LysR family regulator